MPDTSEGQTHLISNLLNNVSGLLALELQSRCRQHEISITRHVRRLYRIICCHPIAICDLRDGVREVGPKNILGIVQQICA